MTNKKVEKGFTMHIRPVQRLKYLPVKETGERKPFNLVQKAIYFFLYAFVKNGRKAYPSLEEIADELGVSRATVHRAIDELVSFGIVRRQYQGKNKSVLYHMASPKIVMEIGKTIPENDVWLNKKHEAVDYEIDWEEAVEAAEAHKDKPLVAIKEAFSSAISFSKECVDRVIEILRSMGTPMNKQMFPLETPQEAPRASRLMAPPATKAIDSAPVTKAPEKREAWEDKWQDVMVTEAGPQYDPEGW